jgi:hypothetical protein
LQQKGSCGGASLALRNDPAVHGLTRRANHLYTSTIAEIIEPAPSPVAGCFVGAAAGLAVAVRRICAG